MITSAGYKLSLYEGLICPTVCRDTEHAHANREDTLVNKLTLL